jgi:hypothetical protein
LLDVDFVRGAEAFLPNTTLHAAVGGEALMVDFKMIVVEKQVVGKNVAGGCRVIEVIDEKGALMVVTMKVVEAIDSEH